MEQFEFLDDSKLKKDLVNAKNVSHYRQDSDRRIRVSVVPPQVHKEIGWSNSKKNKMVSKAN